MIYVAAFQGGIERFITSAKTASDHPIDRFISARMSEPKQSNPQILAKLIALISMAPAEDKSHGWKVIPFLYDLIVAMENNAAVINVSGIPSIEDVRRDFPPDVVFPICTILSALKRADELLPAPSQRLRREPVGRFRELLNSDVYHRYAAAHECIELETGESVLSDIRSRGAELLGVSQGVLAYRRVSMNIISVVPKIVDAAFGKLPGALAQFAGELATKFMDDRKNIVIYQFDDWVNEYSRAHMSHLLLNRVKVTE